MNSTLTALIDRLGSAALDEASVIPWSSPVVSFGDPSRSRIATLGLNPSNREFVDSTGLELAGNSRRFHTLASLGLAKWSDAEVQHLKLILDSCCRYFGRNPYDRWFRELDQIISGTAASYYDDSDPACHLDLVPYATACKWTELTSEQRSSLLRMAGDTLGVLIRDSPVQVVVLNGQTVVDNLQQIAGARLAREEAPDWTLPRRSRGGIRGYAYRGWIRSIAGVELGREVFVLGFNHNIQSSFGVTREVKAAIRSWITRATQEVLS